MARLTDALTAELKRRGIDRCLLCDDPRSLLVCCQCRRKPDYWKALKPKLKALAEAEAGPAGEPDRQMIEILLGQLARETRESVKKCQEP